MMSDRRPPVAAAVSSRAVRPMAVQGDDYAAPYTIRWAESCGGWIIWLPDECLAVDGEPIDVAAGLEDAGGSYPQGWYKLDVAESAESVYLNIYLPPGGDEAEEPEDPSGEFAEDPSQDEDTWPVLIASMAEKAVRQTVSSALVLSGIGGVRWLNDMSGDLEILPDEDASIDIDGETYYVSVRRVAAAGHILIGLTTAPPEDEEGDGYCNKISSDARADEPANEISADDLDDELGGGGSSDDGLRGNAISRWPCDRAES